MAEQEDFHDELGLFHIVLRGRRNWLLEDSYVFGPGFKLGPCALVAGLSTWNKNPLEISTRGSVAG